MGDTPRPSQGSPRLGPARVVSRGTVPAARRHISVPALLLLAALALPPHSSPARAAGRSAVLRLSPAIDAIFAPDARLETLFERDSIFDGPAWVPDGHTGHLIFSDVPGDVIDTLNADGTVSTYLRNIFTGVGMSKPYESLGLGGQRKFPMPGADGITVDSRGRVVYCSYSDGQIVRIETGGRRTILASRFAGKRLNAPNDLVYGSDRSLYFTDSRAGTRREDGDGVPHEGLYVLRARKVLLLSKNIDHPNGVALSPDERYLYVTDTRRRRVLRFDLRAGGIGNEAVFADMSGDREAGAPDGIKVDKAGNVYVTGPGGVWVISASGRHIGTIRTPDKATNMAFGDRDFRSLYVTAFGALYRIRTKNAER